MSRRFSPHSGKWEARECATLGLQWRDVYRDGVLFLRELPTDLAERFVAEPWMWSSPFADITRLRQLVLSEEMKNHDAYKAYMEAHFTNIVSNEERGRGDA